MSNLSSCLVAGFLAIALASASAQTALYTENFNYANGNPNPASGSGNQISLNTCYQNTANESTAGWFIYGKSSGGTVSDSSGQATASWITDRQSPNGPASGSGQYGWLAVNTPAGSSYLLATTSTALGNSAISVAAPNLTFSWYQGDAAAADTVRLAIRSAARGTFQPRRSARRRRATPPLARHLARRPASSTRRSPR